MSNVAFIHRGGEDMASYRYRTQIPAEQLADDYSVSINSGTADIVVFSKPVEEDIELAETCKNDGTKVVVDFCDDHFNHKSLGKVYRDIAKLADTLVCNSEAMQGVIFHETGRDSSAIDDPYEQERMEPHADGLDVLWYGHQRNLEEIIPFVDKIEELSVCTGKNNKLNGYVTWSLEKQEEELAFANTVILPGKVPYKTPNRLINAIMAGCFVVSKSYPEFREFAYIGDIMQGLQWRKHFHEDLNELVSAGQDYIEKTYSPNQIGKQWSSLLASL